MGAAIFFVGEGPLGTLPQLLLVEGEYNVPIRRQLPKPQRCNTFEIKARRYSSDNCFAGSTGFDCQTGLGHIDVTEHPVMNIAPQIHYSRLLKGLVIIDILAITISWQLEDLGRGE